MHQVIADFPGVTFVLAHGGRGHWYADAATLALAGPNVWIDLAGLPPKRLPDYYAGFDLPALARKWIFGTDWPGVPGVARNARAIAALGLSADILSGFAQRQRGPRLPARLTQQAGRLRAGVVRAVRAADAEVSSRLQHDDLAAVQVGAGRQAADLLGGQRERPLRDPECSRSRTFSSASLPCLVHAVASSYSRPLTVSCKAS